MEVRDFELLGNANVATRTFEPGEVLLSERPFLVSSSFDPANHLHREMQQEAEAVQAPLKSFLALDAYLKASESDRARLRSMFAPELDSPPAARHRATAQRVVAWAKRSIAAAKSHEARELERAVLVIVTNSFGLGERLALLERASKFTHSCCPNAVFHWAGDGQQQPQPQQLTFRALRRIEPDAVLTVNYLGRRALFPTTERRYFLSENKFFTCRCERCSGPDLYCPLPCPRCAPAAPSSSAADVDASVPAAGYAYRDTDLADAGVSQVWLCNKCDARFADADLADLVDREQDLVAQALRFADEVRSGRARGPTCLARWDELFAACRNVLGPNHWSSFVLLELRLLPRLASPLFTPDSARSSVPAWMRSFWSWHQRHSKCEPGLFFKEAWLELARAFLQLGMRREAESAVDAVLPQFRLEFGERSPEASAAAAILSSPVSSAAATPPAGGELCANPTCGVTTKDLKACSACRQVKYCSQPCQKAHWKSHKSDCKR